MTFPILVLADNGHFTASLVGAPQVSVIADTREQALDDLRGEIERRVGIGELVALDLRKSSLLALAGKYADDPSLAEICEDAYRQRDAERPK